MIKDGTLPSLSIAARSPLILAAFVVPLRTHKPLLCPADMDNTKSNSASSSVKPVLLASQPSSLLKVRTSKSNRVWGPNGFCIVAGQMEASAQTALICSRFTLDRPRFRTYSGTKVSIAFQTSMVSRTVGMGPWSKSVSTQANFNLDKLI